MIKKKPETLESIYEDLAYETKIFIESIEKATNNMQIK